MNDQTADPALALPDLAAIRAAQVRIAPYVHRTPVLTCRSLDAMAGARLFFKCENLQKVGAFKARGACNAVFGLSAEAAARGVVTHSSGNHGAALAYAARERGIPAHVVMPEGAPKIKVANVEGFGARVHFCAPTVVARVETCALVARTTGATLVHPYDDVTVIAGQGTAALELLEAVPDLDVVVAPVGGGGLLSGTAIAAKGVRPGIVVLGAEPAGADDAARSLAAGSVQPLPHPASPQRRRQPGRGIVLVGQSEPQCLNAQSEVLGAPVKWVHVRADLQRCDLCLGQDGLVGLVALQAGADEFDIWAHRDGRDESDRLREQGAADDAVWLKLASNGQDYALIRIQVALRAVPIIGSDLGLAA